MRQPLIIPVERLGEEFYQGVEEYQFMWGGKFFTIPKGFMANGASVPRLLWPFMPPDGLHRAAAYAHDWIYANCGVMDEGYAFTLSEADTLFYRYLILSGVHPLRARVAYLGLKIGSWYAWQSSDCSPLVTEIRNAAPQHEKRKKRNSSRITRHLYATVGS